jgi:hypothetical protein
MTIVTNTETLPEAQAAVDAALPGLIRTALATYTELATAEPAAQPKEQVSQQQAAKAALAHLETLLRLAQTRTGEAASAQADEAAPETQTGELLAAARAAVHRLRA